MAQHLYYSNMYDIQYFENENGKLFILNGKIDSNNSQEVSDLILPKLCPEDTVTLDFDKVEYISSAGLRIILKIAKIVKDFTLINACRDVYEVFDMTGFTQIIKVKKALREISIEGKELIGEGYMGKVYRLDPDTIIKVYTRYSSMIDIERETALAKKAFVMGIPTAIPFDVVKVKEGGYGSVFELINSTPLNVLIRDNPDKVDEYFKMYVDLLKTMMAVEVDESSNLPNCKDTARSWIVSLREEKAFSEEVLDKLEKLVESIPDSNHFVHGDYHIKNIMVQNGEPLLIDMDTVGRGHPIFEISAFFLTYIGYPSTNKNNIKEFLGIENELGDKFFYGTINEIYKDKTEEEKQEIIDKLSLFGYMWLTYKTLRFEKENTKRLTHSQEVVLKLVDKYQTLNF